MDMDISMDIHINSVFLDIDMDVKFHIHINPVNGLLLIGTRSTCRTADRRQCY